MMISFTLSGLIWLVVGTLSLGVLFGIILIALLTANKRGDKNEDNT